MTATTYSDYTREQAGFLWGLTAWQLLAVVVTGLPAIAFLSVRAWAALAVWAVLWGSGVALITVPVFGRSAVQWLAALVRFEVGRAMGWTTWQSRVAAGKAGPDDEPDLPGVLTGIRTHDGPPFGASMRRVAVIQDTALRTWAVTASIVHPGIGLAEGHDRDRMGQGLSALLEAAARGKCISHVALTVRSIPDDGAEREAWVAQNRDQRAPQVVSDISSALQMAFVPACVRTECFITVVADESTLARAARESGGGVEGRAHALYAAAREIETQLRGPMQCSDVRWLTSPELASAIRTGFAPGDRAALVASELVASSNPHAAAGVPMSAAGPSTAEAERRSYRHDGWESISDTIILPAQGALMGSLAPILAPGIQGERRALTVFYPVVANEKAGRIARGREYNSQMAAALRARLQIVATSQNQQDAAKSSRFDRKLTSGRAMVRPAAVATVTVPRHWRAPEAGRRLDSAIRSAGFTPQRLDLAQDAGFVAGVIPLGVGLIQRRRLT